MMYNSDYGVFQGCTPGGWMEFHKTTQPLGCPSSGLVGRWRLDEAPGSATAADSSGSGNSGTLTNMDPNTDWVAGKLGGALDFDGTDDLVSVSAAASINNLGPLTASFWINPTTMGEGNLGKILTKGTTFAPGSWQISLATSAGCFGGGPSVTNSIFFGKTNAAGSWNYATRCAANNSVSLGSWQHFVVTWDGNSGNVGVHIFKNGSEVTYHASQESTSGSIAADSSLDFLIGNRAAADRTFNGKIDDVRLYNRALSQPEIDALYNGGAGCQ